MLLGGVTLPALFIRNDAIGPLPTPTAFEAVRALIAGGFAGDREGHSSRRVRSRSTSILLWLAFLLLGFLGAAWVVVRRPVGAVVSALAVLTFTGSVGDGPGRNVYAVARRRGDGAFFLSEGRHRIARWGGGRIAIPAWLGLPTLGVACAVAIAAPLVLGETPIVKLPTPIRPRVVIIKPLSDIKRQLKVDPPLEVMRVNADRPTYWRLTGLDAYRRAPNGCSKRARSDVREGRRPACRSAHDGRGPRTELPARHRCCRRGSRPRTRRRRSISNEPVQIDRGSQTLLLRDKTQPGLTYTVTSRQPRVDAEPRSAEPQDPPDGYAELFGGIARPIVAGARTPLDIARRLENAFPDVPLRRGGRRPDTPSRGSSSSCANEPGTASSSPPR